MIIMKIQIKTDLLDHIEKSARNFSYECGGILIGYQKKDDIVVTHIIEDIESEERSPSHFIRVTKNIWTELNNIAKNYHPSDYIGEWHTHPAYFNKPSMIDDLSMLKIVNSKYYRDLHQIILCISIGNESSFWLYDHNTKTRVSYSVI